MPERTYWLDLFTGTTWDEFLEAGAQVSGFSERRWSTVQKFKPGDYLLCYLTGVSRWIGVLEIISEPFQDSATIWKDTVFPSRVKVEPILQLTPETAVPVLEMRDQLTIFSNLKNPNAWTGFFRGSPARMKPEDGRTVVAAIRAAHRNPVRRPVDARKLARRPRALTGAGSPPLVASAGTPVVADPVVPTEASDHTQIQWLLAKLGNDMGLDVWVARNDRGREVEGQHFSDLPRLRDKLPRQFDDLTNRTVELIDVLWLKGTAFVAAFEIESTTSIYSGLLRMADLVAMQPNLKIPLYLVAPDERRQKVMNEVNRPTFSRLSPPLARICRYVSFAVLRQRVGEVGSVARYLKPEFLEQLAESCEPGGD